MTRIYDLLVTWTLLLTLVVIVLGAYTRLTDAGLGCPDWPGCYGQMTVPDKAFDANFKQTIDSDKAWTEMIHRYAAGSLGIFIFIIFTLSILLRRQVGISLVVPGLIVITVLFQAILGMWTVTHLLSPTIVTAHLLGGFTTLSLLFILLLKRLQLRDYYPNSIILKLLSLLALLLVIGQITLGGWVSTNYAALACGTHFPLCLGQWLPSLNLPEAFNVTWQPGVNYEFGTLDSESRATIHFTHRLGALIVATLLIPLSLWIIAKQTGILRFIGLCIFALLCAQISLGILNVVLVLPLGIAVAHNLVAALLLLSVIALNFTTLFRS